MTVQAFLGGITDRDISGDGAVAGHQVHTEIPRRGEQPQGNRLAHRGHQVRAGLVRRLGEAGHVLQPSPQFLTTQQAEVETLAAAEDGARDLVGLGGGEEEVHPRRRLLEDLQQRVEGPLGEHVDLVDDEDPAAALAGRVLGHVPQLADVVDARVAGRVDLQHVQVAALGDGQAGVALAAGIPLAVLGAVQGLGQQPRHRGLAAAAGPGEEVGVTQLVLAHGSTQGVSYMGLPHNLAKGLGTVFPGYRLVRHAAPLVMFRVRI